MLLALTSALRGRQEHGIPLRLLWLDSCLLKFTPKCTGYYFFVSLLITLLCASMLVCADMHMYSVMQQGMTLQLASSASIRGSAQAPHLPGTKLLMHSCTVLHVCSSCPLSGSCDLHCGCIHRPHMRRIQDMYPSCSHHVMTAATVCQIPPMVGNIMDSTCCHYLSLAFMCHAGRYRLV